MEAVNSREHFTVDSNGYFNWGSSVPGYDKWVEDYALRFEPSITEADCRAAFKAGLEQYVKPDLKAAEMPAETYEALLKQFYSLIRLRKTSENLINHYRSREAHLSEKVEAMRKTMEGVALWIEKLPVPTAGATAQLLEIDKAISTNLTEASGRLDSPRKMAA